MKKYIVIYNKNSRGKTYSKQDLEMIFSSHDLDSKIFVTNEIIQVDKIVKNLDYSCKIHLRSDVPVGLMLSGGVDSNIVGYFGNKNYKGKFNSYTFGNP